MDISEQQERISEAIPMVSCGCGPYRCLLHARQVTGMVAETNDAIPLEHWLGLLDPPADATRRYLSLTTPDRQITVSVAAPVNLVEISPKTIFPLPPFIETNNRSPALRALQYQAGQWQLVLRLF